MNSVPWCSAADAFGAVLRILSEVLCRWFKVLIPGLTGLQVIPLWGFQLSFGSVSRLSNEQQDVELMSVTARRWDEYSNVGAVSCLFNQGFGGKRSIFGLTSAATR